MKNSRQEGVNMKKKLAVMLIMAMTVSMLSACGADKEKTEEGQTQSVETESSTAGADTESAETILLKDYDVESCVALNEYKGMAVTLEKPVVTDADVESYITSVLSNYGGKEEFAIMDRAVEEGDTVNINYSGKLDGVAFEGGTDDSEEGTNLGIGSNSFFDGFEDGLIGVMPGETVDLNLTFPENYQSVELAGKETVFTVTVNGIAPTVADLTDEMAVALNEETATVDAYKQSVLEMLTEEAQANFDSSYDTSVEDALIQKMMDECTFKELPEEVVTKYKNTIVNNMTQTAAMYQMDLDSYVAAAYGSYEEFENMMTIWAENSAKQAIAFQAIANKENLNVDDGRLAEELETYAQSYGYESADELGEDMAEDYREYLMFMDVLDFLRENAQVTVE